MFTFLVRIIKKNLCSGLSSGLSTNNGLGVNDPSIFTNNGLGVNDPSIFRYIMPVCAQWHFDRSIKFGLWICYRDAIIGPMYAYLHPKTEMVSKLLKGAKPLDVCKYIKCLMVAFENVQSEVMIVKNNVKERQKGIDIRICFLDYFFNEVLVVSADFEDCCRSNDFEAWVEYLKRSMKILSGLGKVSYRNVGALMLLFMDKWEKNGYLEVLRNNLMDLNEIPVEIWHREISRMDPKSKSSRSAEQIRKDIIALSHNYVDRFRDLGNGNEECSKYGPVSGNSLKK